MSGQINKNPFLRDPSEYQPQNFQRRSTANAGRSFDLVARVADLREQYGQQSFLEKNDPADLKPKKEIDQEKLKYLLEQLEDISGEDLELNDLEKFLYQNGRPKYSQAKALDNAKSLWESGDQEMAADLFEQMSEQIKKEYLKENLTVRRLDTIEKAKSHEQKFLDQSNEASEQDIDTLINDFMGVVGENHDLFFKAANKERSIFLVDQIIGKNSITGGGIGGTYYSGTDYMTIKYEGGNFTRIAQHELIHALDYADGKGDGSLSGIEYKEVMNKSLAKIKDNNNNLSGLPAWRLSYASSNNREFVATMSPMFLDDSLRPAFEKHFPELTEVFEEKYGHDDHDHTTYA